jgi:excisionase family DNA binding protein
MPRTTRKPRRPKAPPPAAPRPATVPDAEVFTLAEAAAYLRLSEEEVLRLVRDQNLPGRQMGAEWRFLKAAVQDWLRTPPPVGSKEAQMAAVGILKDDPTIDEFLKEVYRQRGRPMTEDGE